MSTFRSLDDLWLQATVQHTGKRQTVLAYRITSDYWWCERCGCQGKASNAAVRLMSNEPYGQCPTILHVSVRCYRCQECAHVWCQDLSQAADPRTKLSRSAVPWALTGVVVHHLTVARIAEALSMSWNTANTAVLEYRQHRCPG